MELRGYTVGIQSLPGAALLVRYALLLSHFIRPWQLQLKFLIIASAL